MNPFHPIVQQTPPSADQAPGVATIDRDVVLVAGAGKTRTLVVHVAASRARKSITVTARGK